jgi:predicted nuclease of predicted toxin-antitoxin system
MRVLLDECVPRKLKKSLQDHECQTVPEAGLAGKTNGELLAAAERLGFDVLITLDIIPHVPACLAGLGGVKTGQLVRIGF